MITTHKGPIIRTLEQREDIKSVCWLVRNETTGEKEFCMKVNKTGDGEIDQRVTMRHFISLILRYGIHCAIIPDKSNK